MSPLGRLLAFLKPRPRSPEGVAAAAEAARMRDEMETIRLSQRSTAGQNYQSGRGPGS